ncbi:MAG: proteasome subunit alpha [Limisphaerales bacterium]
MMHRPHPPSPTPSSSNSPPPVAGDFLALLDRHQLALPAGDATRAPVQTTATTVFAFHFADGVLVAGDRRATAGNLIVTDRVEKILELDAVSLLAVAGVPATAFEMARALRTSFEYYRRSQLQPLSLPGRVRALSRALRDNLALTLQGVGVVAPLFIGLDTSVSPARPEIFFYDPLGAQFQAVGHAASGSGAGTIRSLFTYHERFGDPPPGRLDLPAAVRFALRLLIVAAEFDTATGGVAPEAARFATLKVLSPSGIRTVPEADQRRWIS